jgi:hypothetical protein
MRIMNQGDQAGEVCETVECLRCRVRVEVTAWEPLSIAYDLGAWLAKCCCSHLSGPVHCCSFLALERLVAALPGRSRVE